MDRKRAVFWAFLLLFSVPSSAQLRDYVALVEPVFHTHTLESFTTCARFFASCDEPDIAAFFYSYAGRGGPRRYGSGWVHVSAAGNVFVVTNGHVVSQAESARVSFETVDGAQRVFAAVPIAYVDDDRDIAVLLLPAGSFERGLELSPVCPEDGTPIYAVGFPDFNGRPLWQFSAGIVSNAAARIDDNVAYLIQHTAPIDPGNSGGPLLVPVSSGYAVVGMNTAVAAERQNTNFAIPVGEIRPVVAAADRAVALSSDPDACRGALLTTANEIRVFLTQKQPDCRVLNEYVSYDFVARRGLRSFVEVLYIVSNDARWMHALFTNPIDAMRAAIAVRLAYDLGRMPPVCDANAVSIEILSDERAGAAPPENLVTRYHYAGRSRDVEWTWEYGEWRVRSCATQDIVNINANVFTDPRGGLDARARPDARGGE